MASQPQGAPRWDPQTQRWVSDGPAQAPAPAPAAPAPAPPQAPAPGQTWAPSAPGLPPVPPGYGPGPAHPGAGASSELPPVPRYDPYDPYDQYPGPVPPGPPRPDGPRGRWLTPTTAVVAVVALAIGAAAVWFVERNQGDEPVQAGPTAASAPATAGGSGTPSPTGTGTRSSGPSPSPSPSASPSPSGGAPHETVRDAKGFTVAVPAGWVREEAASGVFYRSPDRASLVQIFQVSEADLSPLGAVQGASSYLRAQTSGYQEIRVGPAPGADGAGELVYEYDSVESHGRRRGIERVFFAQDGKKWAVLTAGPAADWTLTQDHHAAALAAFRPGG